MYSKSLLLELLTIFEFIVMIYNIDDYNNFRKF